MGRRRRGEAIDGVLLLDKPGGVTSNYALQSVRRAFNAKKAGHAGCLDPMATGLLPICLGEATKFSQYWLDADKAYQATLQLGSVTDSGDATGEVIESRPVPNSLTQDFFETLFANMQGEHRQVPPMFSALKHQGKPLYYYARQGVEIERPARQVTLYSISLMHCDLVKGQVSFEVTCSKGTYIRTLCEQIGETANCGAHLIALRRTKVGEYRVADAANLEQLLADPKAYLERDVQGLEQALSHLPQVLLGQEDAAKLTFGQAVWLPKQTLDQSQVQAPVVVIATCERAGVKSDLRSRKRVLGVGYFDSLSEEIDASAIRLMPKRLVSTQELESTS